MVSVVSFNAIEFYLNDFISTVLFYSIAQYFKIISEHLIKNKINERIINVIEKIGIDNILISIAKMVSQSSRHVS